MDIKAYKLLKLRKDGSVGSLFMNCRRKLPLNVWLKAESHRTEGFAYRPLWHTVPSKNAPHLSKKGRVWAEVSVRGVTEFKKPKYQGGKWLLAKYLKINKLCIT